MIVDVEWEDSCVDSGWHLPSDDSRHTTSKCRTVGILLKKDSKAIHIYQSESYTSGQIDGVMSIPRKCVTSIKKL